jgi:hypothetical protein
MKAKRLVQTIARHLDDSDAFRDDASRASTCVAANRHLNASLYELRGAVDNLRTAAKRGQLRIDAPRLDRFLDKRMPQARLVRRLRNLHFHDEALRGPPSIRLELAFAVPPLSTSTASLTVDHANPRFGVAGVVPGTLKFFLVSGWLVQDELEETPVFVPDLLRRESANLRSLLPLISRLDRAAA